MSMDITEKTIQRYVETATDLAESVKRNIAHEGIIDNETVLKLNAFIIAANAIKDLNIELNDDSNETDGKLN